MRKVFLKFLTRKSDAFLPSRAGVAKNFEDGDRTVRQVFCKCNEAFEYVTCITSGLENTEHKLLQLVIKLSSAKWFCPLLATKNTG